MNSHPRSRFARFAILTTIVIALAAHTVGAQFVVHDPTNYAQALTRYAQMLQQYRLWLAQARRLPSDLAARYRVPQPRWRSHDTTASAYARSLLSSLNSGDSSGAGYRGVVDQLTDLTAILPMLPADLQRRLSDTYTTIQLADSIALTGVDQIGRIRANGGTVLTAIANMENDALAFSEDLHTQIAVLNKINGANVLALRLNEATNQLQMHALEQLLVQNKRARDAETTAMNARLFQWRYGAEYGRALFARTATGLDAWRQP